MKFAGTDDRIRVKLIGDCGETEDEYLSEKMKDFERVVMKFQ